MVQCSKKKVGSGVTTKFRAVADVADVEHVPLSILYEPSLLNLMVVRVRKGLAPLE